MKIQHVKINLIVILVLIMWLAGCASHTPSASNLQSAASVQRAERPAIAEDRTQAREKGDRPAPASVMPVEIPESSETPAPETLETRTYWKPDPELSEKKESPTQIAVKRKLETVRIGTLDFHEEKLSSVFKVLTAVSGVNFAVEEYYNSGKSTWLPSHLEKSYEDQGDGDNEDEDEILESKISVYLKDVTLKTAISVICKDKDLRWEIDDDGIVRVSDENDQIKVSFDHKSFSGLGCDMVFSRGIITELDAGGKKLKKILGELSRRTGVNIVCKPYLDNWSIFIHLENVTLQTAIEAICEKYYMWYTYSPKKDYVCLIGNEEFQGETSVDYRVKTRVFNLQYASAPQVADAIGCVMGDRVEYVVPANLRSYEHIKLPDLENKEGKIESKESDTETNKEIDVPEIESENLSLEKIKSVLDNKLGLSLTAADIRWINRQVGFGVMSIFLRNNAILASSTDDRILQEIEELVSQMDTPTPQVLIECRILNVTLTDNFSSFFQVSNFEYSQKGGGNQPYGTDTKLLSVPTFGASGAEALYSFVNDKLKLDLKLELLQKDGLVNTIATPMIVAAQNTEAEVASGIANVPMFSDIDVIAPSFDEEGNITTQGYTSPQYDTVDLVGTRLRITPQINRDRSVTLRIDLEQSAIQEDGATIQYASFDNSGNPNSTWSNQSVDTLRSNTLKTIAAVPEGYTLALGGLIEEQETVSEEKVPILGDIPVIGFFFKDESKVKQRSEMIILLTPRVLMAPTEAGRVTAEVLEGTEHPASKQGRKYMFEYDEDRKKLHKVE